MAQRFCAAGLDQFSPRSFPHSPHEFAGAVGVFPEDVVDVFEGLCEHGHWEGRLRNNGKGGVSESGSGASGVSNISFFSPSPRVLVCQLDFFSRGVAESAEGGRLDFLRELRVSA